MLISKYFYNFEAKLGEKFYASVSDVRSRLMTELNLIGKWPGQRRIKEIRKSLCVYDKSEPVAKMSSKIIPLIKIYNETCRNVITGPLGLSVDESLIVMGLIF